MILYNSVAYKYNQKCDQLYTIKLFAVLVISVKCTRTFSILVAERTTGQLQTINAAFH